MNSTLQWTPRKLVAALIAAGMIGGAGVVALEHAHTPVHAQGVAVAQVAQAAPAAPAAMVAMPNFSAITAKYGPAVVNISVSGTRKVSMNGKIGRAHV